MSPATEISWNQTGPGGATILSGTGAPGIGVGLAGDYYIETSNHKIFGAAARVCTQLPCRTLWGAGTSLVGPAGQGYSYDTSTAGTVNDPSGQDENVLIQTLPVGGDFPIDARVVGHNSAGNSTRWQCSLFAANPGDPTGVLLDTTAATNSEKSATMGMRLTCHSRAWCRSQRERPFRSTARSPPLMRMTTLNILTSRRRKSLGSRPLHPAEVGLAMGSISRTQTAEGAPEVLVDGTLRYPSIR